MEPNARRGSKILTPDLGAMLPEPKPADLQHKVQIVVMADPLATADHPRDQQAQALAAAALPMRQDGPPPLPKSRPPAPPKGAGLPKAAPATTSASLSAATTPTEQADLTAGVPKTAGDGAPATRIHAAPKGGTLRASPATPASATTTPQHSVAAAAASPGSAIDRALLPHTAIQASDFATPSQFASAVALTPFPMNRDLTDEELALAVRQDPSLFGEPEHDHQAGASIYRVKYEQLLTQEWERQGRERPSGKIVCAWASLTLAAGGATMLMVLANTGPLEKLRDDYDIPAERLWWSSIGTAAVFGTALAKAVEKFSAWRR